MHFQVFLEIRLLPKLNGIQMQGRMNELVFKYESLDVWNVAIDFATSLIEIGNSLKDEFKCYRLVDQLQAASTSISMNIAEGQGRNSDKSFVLFLSYSRGSLFEVLTLIEIFYRLEWLTQTARDTVRTTGLRIVKMLNALISSLSKADPAS